MGGEGHVEPFGESSGSEGRHGIFACHASVTFWNCDTDSAEIDKDVHAALGSRIRGIHGAMTPWPAVGGR